MNLWLKNDKNKYGESVISKEKVRHVRTRVEEILVLDIYKRLKSESQFTIINICKQKYYLPLKLLKNHKISQLKKLTGPRFPDQGETGKQIMQHEVTDYPFFQYCKDATFLRASYRI